MMDCGANSGLRTSASFEAVACIRGREAGPENDANVRRSGALAPINRKAEKSSSKIALRFFSMVRKDLR